MSTADATVPHEQDSTYNKLLEQIDDHLDEYEALYKRAENDHSLQPLMMRHCQAIRYTLRRAQAMRPGLRDQRTQEHFDNIDYLQTLFYKVTTCQFHGHGADDKESHMQMDGHVMKDYLRANNADSELNCKL